MNIFVIGLTSSATTTMWPGTTSLTPAITIPMPVPQWAVVWWPESVRKPLLTLKPGGFLGPSTLSSDLTMLYLIHFGTPTSEVAAKIIRNRIRSANVLDHGTSLAHRNCGSSDEINITITRCVGQSAETCHPLDTAITIDLYRTLYRSIG